ncbi:MAG: hypothetical protein K0Q51_581 [Rickettsiaceae bacterium]|nr:hypothetical protein [Rickettsiaceae bacterium]
MKYLLRLNIDIDLKGENSLFELIKPTSYGGIEYHYVDILVDLGIDLNSNDKDGFNILFYFNHREIKTCQYKNFFALINNGIDVLSKAPQAKKYPCFNHDEYAIKNWAKLFYAPYVFDLLNTNLGRIGF